MQKITNQYLGNRAKLISIKKQAEGINLYTFNLPGFSFIPGQFVMLSLPGFGEAPFAPCSDPAKSNQFQLSIRRVGIVTTALEKLQKYDFVDIRGPFGNGFPLKKLSKKDLILVAGGMGIAPLASLIEFLLRNRRSFNQIYLLYGAKTTSQLLFRNHYTKWQKKINIELCVEEKDANWEGKTGFVTGLCHRDQIKVNPQNTAVVMCGPVLMYQNNAEALAKLDIKPEQILVSMEAKMKCGVGKCQHCTLGKKYTCLDGPVFQYSEIANDF